MLRNARLSSPILAILFLVSCGDSTGPVRLEDGAEGAVAAESANEADGIGTDEPAEDPPLDDVARYQNGKTPQGVEKVAAFIGPEGGSLRLHDFELIVPPGAVSKRRRFEIRIMPEPARRNHAAAEFRPRNVTFEVPVLVRVPLETTESAGATDVHVLRFEKGADWEALFSEPTVDGRLQTTTSSFTTFGTERRRGITMAGG